MADRVDQLEDHYLPIEKFDQWARIYFWVGVVLSLALPHSNIFLIDWVHEILSVSFILAVILYSIFSNYNSYYLVPAAEKIRRKQLLSDSFNILFTHEKTVGYYNNELDPSIARLAANILENAFFAKNVCKTMAENERLKVLFYLVIWVTAISLRGTDLSTILILTQVVFSGELILRWIKLEMLKSNNDSIYDELYNIFLNRLPGSSPLSIVSILNSFAAYESAKARASIKQSSKIFNQLNPKLSKEWDEIRGQLNMNQ